MVHVGDLVNPGTVLAVISANKQESNAVVLLPQNIVQYISRLSASTLSFSTQKLSLRPSYIATNATDGQLYAITYAIPSAYNDSLSDGGSIAVSLPLAQPTTQTADPAFFIPLDAVYQTQNSAYVYLQRNHRAKSQNVMLGNVFGDFVQVTSGIAPQNVVILSRDVIDGEEVTTK